MGLILGDARNLDRSSYGAVPRSLVGVVGFRVWGLVGFS